MNGTSTIVFSIYLISYVITDNNGSYFKLSKKFIKRPVFFSLKFLGQDCFLKTPKFKSNTALKLSEMPYFLSEFVSLKVILKTKLLYHVK